MQIKKRAGRKQILSQKEEIFIHLTNKFSLILFLSVLLPNGYQYEIPTLFEVFCNIESNKTYEEKVLYCLQKGFQAWREWITKICKGIESPNELCSPRASSQNNIQNFHLQSFILFMLSLESILFRWLLLLLQRTFVWFDEIVRKFLDLIDTSNLMI